MPEPDPTPQACRARREALGLSPVQAGRRAGLTPEALQRYERGEGGLTGEQVAALVRALGAPVPGAAAPPQRAMLDFGLVGAVVFLLGGAFPGAGALVAGVDMLRFLDSGVADARVVGFERRQRLVRPDTGESYTIETVVPLLRFIRPDGGGEATIAWRETLPEEAALAEGDRIRLIVPRGAPDRAEASMADILARPLVLAAMAAPMMVIGALSLGHWRRRRRAGG